MGAWWWIGLAFAAWHHFMCWVGLDCHLRIMFTSCTIISIGSCVSKPQECNLSRHRIERSRLYSVILGSACMVIILCKSQGQGQF